VLLLVGGFLLLGHLSTRLHIDRRIELLVGELGHPDAHHEVPKPAQLPCCHQVGLSCGDDACSCVGYCLGQ